MMEERGGLHTLTHMQNNTKKIGAEEKLRNGRVILSGGITFTVHILLNK